MKTLINVSEIKGAKAIEDIYGTTTFGFGKVYSEGESLGMSFKYVITDQHFNYRFNYYDKFGNEFSLEEINLNK